MLSFLPVLGGGLRLPALQGGICVGALAAALTLAAAAQTALPPALADADPLDLPALDAFVDSVLAASISVDDPVTLGVRRSARWTAASTGGAFVQDAWAGQASFDDAPDDALGFVAAGPDPRRFLRWTGQDALALARDVGPRLPFYALGAAALLVPASSLDQPVADGVAAINGGFMRSYLNITNELGGKRASIPVALLFAGSLLTDNERFQDAAFTSLQALAFANVGSAALKGTVGRARPYLNEGPHTFDPLAATTRYGSFPSGHTTSIFAVVTPWVVYYPHPVTYGLYALAAGTGMARVAHDMHWATDVLTGAVLGTATGYWLARRHLRGPSGSTIQITPQVAPGHLGVGVQVPLGRE